MVMSVEGNGARYLGPKQILEGRVVYYGLRVTGAAHMPVQADDSLRSSHYQVQIVGHQQDTAASAISNSRDQVIKARLAGYVHARRRLIKNE